MAIADMDMEYLARLRETEATLRRVHAEKQAVQSLLADKPERDEGGYLIFRVVRVDAQCTASVVSEHGSPFVASKLMRKMNKNARRQSTGSKYNVYPLICSHCELPVCQCEL